MPAVGGLTSTRRRRHSRVQIQHGDNRGVRTRSTHHRQAGHTDFPDGHLRGYYHTSLYKIFIPVAGGRDGTYIWF